MKPRTSSRDHRRARRSRAGFTIAELMGVAIVLGLSVTIVAVSWKAMLPRTVLSTEVRVLGDTLHGTRSDAIARSVEFEVHYDLDNEAYWILSPFKVEGGRAVEREERATLGYHALPEGLQFTEITIDGEPYSDGVVYVRFTPMGAASDHTIVLYQEIFDRYYTIEVLALTGLIRFHDDVVRREAPDEGDFD